MPGEPRNSGQTHRFDEVIQRKVPIAGMGNEPAAQTDAGWRLTSNDNLILLVSLIYLK